MGHLDDLDDPGQAREVLLQLAGGGPKSLVLKMLTEALDQIEYLAPQVGGDVWDAYLAVERAAAQALRNVT